jgi:hypothetical protein
MPSMCRYRSQVCTLSERMPPTEAARKDWQHWRDSGEVWHLRVQPVFLLALFQLCRCPSIRATALSRQRYPGRCVSTACFAREG